MKILILSRYDSLGASSRMRMLQYIPLIISSGAEIISAPLFSNSYVEEIQKDKRRFSKIFFSYLKRMKLLIFCKDIDVIWIEKECFPWIPWWFEKLFLKKNIPYFLDYDDAVFHLYDQHKHPLIKFFLMNKHPKLIKDASAIVVGNEYLFKYVQEFYNGELHIIPTAIDLNRYPYPSKRDPKNASSPIHLGWIGQHSTAYNLKFLETTFKKLSSKKNIIFSAIGINAKIEGLSMNSLPWSYETEVGHLNEFDIGIMPLVDGSFEHGKCGYKIIQYMACGLPVIASPVGVNKKIIDSGVNGILASTEKEWERAINYLLDNPELKYSMGDAGRKLVESKYCIQVTSRKLIALLHNVGQKKG
ncbi:glycosyltransferase family 4 protein [Pseudomonadota bacterium]|nr:glycosyltransferase family 4 protein [Pseudomonadota bacterium]